MPRSSNVYTVQRGLVVVAAFTVMYELRAWLRRQDDAQHLAVTRLPDGGHHPERNAPLSVAAILEGANP